MKGCGSIQSHKWLRQSVTKNWVPLINAVAVSERRAWLAHQSRPKKKEKKKKKKTQGAGGISNKKAQSSSFLHHH